MTDGFDPARQVGEGGFGKVYWARSKDRDVAIKRLDKDAAMSAKYVRGLSTVVPLWTLRTPFKGPYDSFGLF